MIEKYNAIPKNPKNANSHITKFFKNRFRNITPTTPNIMQNIKHLNAYLLSSC